MGFGRQLFSALGKSADRTRYLPYLPDDIANISSILRVIDLPISGKINYLKQ